MCYPVLNHALFSHFLARPPLPNAYVGFGNDGVYVVYYISDEEICKRTLRE